MQYSTEYSCSGVWYCCFHLTSYFTLENLTILHRLSSIIIHLLSRDFNIVDADAALRTGRTRPLIVWEALQRVGALQKHISFWKAVVVLYYFLLFIIDPVGHYVPIFLFHLLRYGSMNNVTFWRSYCCFWLSFFLGIVTFVSLPSSTTSQ